MKFTYHGRDQQPVSFNMPQVGLIHVEGRDAEVVKELKAAGLYDEFEKKMKMGETVCLWNTEPGSTRIRIFVFVGKKDDGGFFRFEGPLSDKGLATLAAMVAPFYGTIPALLIGSEGKKVSSWQK